MLECAAITVHNNVTLFHSATIILEGGLFDSAMLLYNAVASFYYHHSWQTYTQEISAKDVCKTNNNVKTFVKQTTMFC